MENKMILQLNLVDLGKSDIKYTISKFPDGQQSITITEHIFSKEIEKVQILSRMNTFMDVELIICSNQVLKEIGVKDVELYVPYFIGGRSDRKFGYGETNYLKTVICPIINLQNFSKVSVIDPHSDVLEACLNNFKKINNFELVKNALLDLARVMRKFDRDEVVLVSPDAGAYKKVYDVAKEFNLEKIITATKVRDLKNGNILRTEVPTLDQHNNLMYLIIDDICDGGRTFVELAKVIKEGRPTAKVYLIVTHGIFSSGFKDLNKFFEKIFTTNSISDRFENEDVLNIINIF
jgi:ribose-phosphate pyrophosphokinase